MKLSVLLASYNGEEFIAKQIYSILNQLSSDDELIVSDDGSTDSTLRIIDSINDPRLFVYEGPREGINSNYANAYKYSTGEGVLFSDQDDVWLPGRLELFRKKLKKYDFIFFDAEVIDEKGVLLSESYFDKNRTSKTFFGNFIKCRTLGCCIGFRKAVIGKRLKVHKNYDILPYDYSLTLLSLFYFKVFFSKKPYHQYRRHKLNYSYGGEKSMNSLWKMLIFRVRVLVYVLNAKNWLPKK